MIECAKKGHKAIRYINLGGEVELIKEWMKQATIVGQYKLEEREGGVLILTREYYCFGFKRPYQKINIGNYVVFEDNGEYTEINVYTYSEFQKNFVKLPSESI